MPVDSVDSVRDSSLGRGEIPEAGFPAVEAAARSRIR